MKQVTIIRTEPIETVLSEFQTTDPMEDKVQIRQGSLITNFNRRDALILSLELITWAKSGSSTPIRP
jgi:hypothetical protein